MGAIVGQAALIAAPDRIGRAVLANTAAQLGTPDIWNARIEAVRRDGMEAIAGTVAARWFTAEFRRAEPEIVEAILFVLRENPPEGYAAACAAIRDADQREAIRSIRNKVLVIVGRDDSSAPPELGVYVASAIEGARLVTLEAAHISHLEQTEAFLRATLEFLAAPDAPVRKLAPPPKTAARRRAARQPAARRAPPKAPAKKAPAKIAALKKAPAKKTAAVQKKALVAKAPPKKALTKAPARTAPTGKATAKKSVVKKSAAKSAAAKSPLAKSAGRKAASKKASTKGAASKASVKKPAVKKASAKPAARKAHAKRPPRKAPPKRR
jgi:3-oxoadipate enol-lactonase